MPIKEVIASVKRLADLHAIMVEVADRKKRLIIANNVDDLTKLLTQEARGIKMIEDEESRRLEAVTRFLFAQGIRLQGRISISELSKLVTDPVDKRNLLNERARLEKLVGILKDKNELNVKLTEQALQYINFSLDLMFGAPEADYIYQKPSPNPYDAARKGYCEYRA